MKLNSDQEALVCLADVKSQRVEWLWYPYIPFGKITLAEGDPGVGKSWFTMALASAISTGSQLPGASNLPQGNVIIFSAEDDPADTLRPRLEKLNADMSNIFVYPKPIEFDEKGLTLVESFVSSKSPRLLIIDPMQCYMGKKDMNKANETRSVLAPLTEISAKYGCAVLVVRHLKKGSDKSTYRGMGSIDILAAVRSVLLIGCDQREKNSRVIIHNKSNLAKFGPAIGYEVEDGVFSWTGESALTAQDILSSDLGDPEEKSAREEAAEFLSEFLSAGQRKSRDVFKVGRSEGHFEKTLRRAKKDLGICHFRSENALWWELPGGQLGHGP